MIRYVKVTWIHEDNEECPSLYYYELDEDGYEIRKVEIFKDGRFSYIDKAIEVRTFRNEMAFPSVEEYNRLNKSVILNNNETLFAENINKKVFNHVWQEWVIEKEQPHYQYYEIKKDENYSEYISLEAVETFFKDSNDFFLSSNFVYQTKGECPWMNISLVQTKDGIFDIDVNSKIKTINMIEIITSKIDKKSKDWYQKIINKVTNEFHWKIEEVRI